MQPGTQVRNGLAWAWSVVSPPRTLETEFIFLVGATFLLLRELEESISGSM